MKIPKGVVILLTVMILVWPEFARTSSIQDFLENAQQKTRYRLPETDELARAETLFGRMLEGAGDPDALSGLKTEWQALGMALETVTDGGRTFLALSESPSQRRGRGVFLFPAMPVGDLLLQAPHSFKDLYTGDIGRRIFLEGRFSGAAWNTVPRDAAIEGAPATADLSDLTDTWFAALARAFARRYPNGHVVQLHGYAQECRRSLAGAVSDMIISNGTDHPPPWLAGMDRCLEDRFSVAVSRFPIEIGELGATQTSIGRVLRQMGHAGFLHLEMSKPMRERLRDNEDARRDLLGCLGEVLGW